MKYLPYLLSLLCVVAVTSAATTEPSTSTALPAAENKDVEKLETPEDIRKKREARLRAEAKESDDLFVMWPELSNDPKVRTGQIYLSEIVIDNTTEFSFAHDPAKFFKAKDTEIDDEIVASNIVKEMSPSDFGKVEKVYKRLSLYEPKVAKNGNIRIALPFEEGSSLTTLISENCADLVAKDTTGLKNVMERIAVDIVVGQLHDGIVLKDISLDAIFIGPQKWRLVDVIDAEVLKLWNDPKLPGKINDFAKKVFELVNEKCDAEFLHPESQNYPVEIENFFNHVSDNLSAGFATLHQGGRQRKSETQGTQGYKGFKRAVKKVISGNDRGVTADESLSPSIQHGDSSVPEAQQPVPEKVQDSDAGIQRSDSSVHEAPQQVPVNVQDSDAGIQRGDSSVHEAPQPVPEELQDSVAEPVATSSHPIIRPRRGSRMSRRLKSLLCFAPSD